MSATRYLTSRSVSLARASRQPGYRRVIPEILESVRCSHPHDRNRIVETLEEDFHRTFSPEFAKGHVRDHPRRVHGIVGELGDVRRGFLRPEIAKDPGGVFPDKNLLAVEVADQTGMLRSRSCCLLRRYS
jgi:hypothetical protein